MPGSNRTRHQLLLEEYVQTARSGAPQPAHGQRGQLTAVWNHRLSDAEVSSIQGGHFPIWFMHGRHDVVALARFAEQLAHRLGAPCLVVDGAHFIPRDCGHEVNVLLGAIFSRKIKPFVQQSMWIEEHPPTSLSGGGADGDGSDAAAAAPGSSSSSSQQRGRDYSRSADPAVRDGSAADLGTSVSSPSARRQGVAVSVSAQGQGASPKASAAAAGGSASLKGSSGSSTTSNKRSGSLSTEGGSPCAADGAGVPPAAAGLASLITSGSAAAAAAAKAKVA